MPTVFSVNDPVAAPRKGASPKARIPPSAVASQVSAARRGYADPDDRCVERVPLRLPCWIASPKAVTAPSVDAPVAVAAVNGCDGAVLSIGDDDSDAL